MLMRQNLFALLQIFCASDKASSAGLLCASPPSTNVVVKLFLGPRIVTGAHSVGGFLVPAPYLYPVRVKIPNRVKSDVLQCIRNCARSSRMLWTAARLGELKESAAAVGIDVHEAHRVVSALLIMSERKHGVRWVLRQDVFRSLDPLVFLRSAALVSCGLGLNAYEWSKHRLTPVLVEFRGKEFLALVANSALQNDDHYQFFLTEVQQNYFGSGVNRRFCLLARSRNIEADICVSCLFPPDFSVFGWERCKIC
jgi:hypothetical protein